MKTIRFRKNIILATRNIYIVKIKKYNFSNLLKYISCSYIFLKKSQHNND